MCTSFFGFEILLCLTSAYPVWVFSRILVLVSKFDHFCTKMNFAEPRHVANCCIWRRPYRKVVGGYMRGSENSSGNRTSCLPGKDLYPVSYLLDFHRVAFKTACGFGPVTIGAWWLSTPTKLAATVVAAYWVCLFAVSRQLLLVCAWPTVGFCG